MTIENCESALQRTADAIRPILEPLGYNFQFDQSGQGHSDFAAGFFVRSDARIGLIYRDDEKLGYVIYENDVTSAGHNELMKDAGLSSEQHLLYDESQFRSFSRDGGDVITALATDLRNLSPHLRDPEVLSQMIVRARKARDSAAEEELARQRSRVQERLKRRLGR